MLGLHCEVASHNVEQIAEREEIRLETDKWIISALLDHFGVGMCEN